MNLSSRFRYIFWGLLVAILDIEVNRFDVLPDVVGYGLVMIGASGLLALSRYFLLTKNLAFILLIIAALNYALDARVSEIYGLIYLVLDVLLLWNLLSGVMKFSEQCQREDLKIRADHLRYGYAVLMSLIGARGLILHQLPEGIAIITIIFVISILVMLVLILNLIHKVKHELPNRL